MTKTTALRILLVQLPAELLHRVCQLLRDAGHEVACAPEAGAALDRARRMLPAVVLVHLTAEEQSGYAVTRGLREQSAWRRPLLIALADTAEPLAPQRSLEAGIDLHLVQPVDLEPLLAVLRRFQRLVAETESFDPVI